MGRKEDTGRSKTIHWVSEGPRWAQTEKGCRSSGSLPFSFLLFPQMVAIFFFPDRIKREGSNIKDKDGALLRKPAWTPLPPGDRTPLPLGHFLGQPCTSLVLAPRAGDESGSISAVDSSW